MGIIFNAAFLKKFWLNQQQGHKVPLHQFVSLSFTMTIGFLSQGINKGRFLVDVDDGYEEFSVWYAWESFLWNEDIKSLDYKYLNSNSIFTPLLMNYDLPKPGQDEKQIQNQKSKVQAFFVSANNVVFTKILNAS